METPPLNPFEPPRTADLDGAPDGAAVVLSVSEEELHELSAAAPWVRWLARLTAVSIAIGLVDLFWDAARPGYAAGTAERFLGVALGAALSTVLLFMLRRYVAASNRVRAGDRNAVGQVIAAQAACFKLVGIVLAAAGIIVAAFVSRAFLIGGPYR